MPQFIEGELKTATIPVSNPTPKALSYETLLYLGVEAAASRSESFSLNPTESKDIPFPITMPGAGNYPVFFDVYSGGTLLKHYQASEDVSVLAGQWITRGFMRNDIDPTVSIYNSGWSEFPQLDVVATYLSQIGNRIEAGFCWKNIRSVPVTCSYVMWHNHFVWDAGYQDSLLTPQTQPPTKYDDAPTGLPYFGGQYQCDVFAPPGTVVQPGQVAFIHTEGWYRALYENKIYLTLIIDGVAVETVYLGGWGS